MKLHFFHRRIVNRGSSLVFLFSVVLLILTKAEAKAQAIVGELMLDPTFGVNGLYDADFGFSAGEVTAFVAYKKGPIIVAGRVDGSNGNIRIALMRYAADGSIDPQFGSDSKAVLSWGHLDIPKKLLFLPSDGKLLIVGASSDTSIYTTLLPSLYRVTPSGQPDTSFAHNGRFVAPLNDSSVSGYFTTLDTITLQSGPHAGEPRLLACGSLQPESSEGISGFYAMRFDTSGNVDSSFGLDGAAFVPSSIVYAEGCSLPDGSVLFCGSRGDTPQRELGLCKLTADGAIDSSFGNDGLFTTGIQVEYPDPFFTVRSKSTLIVVAAIGPSKTYSLVRFNADGSLVSTFGDNGILKDTLLNGFTPHGLLLSNDQSILLSGASYGRSAAFKSFDTGSVDRSFGKNGLLQLDPAGGTSNSYVVGFNAIGMKKYAAGGSIEMTPKGPQIFAARYIPQVSGVENAASTSTAAYAYPNPASSTTALEFGNSRNDQLTKTDRSTVKLVRIYDAIGRQIKEASYPADHRLDVRSLPNGLYQTVGVSESGSEVGSALSLIVYH